MKTQVFDPFATVRETGGCTFESHLGWWTQCESALQASELGRPFVGKRDAIYIPTLQKDGHPVASETIESLKKEARELGLDKTTRASGMRVLSETNEVQAETIWVLFAEQSVDKAQLKNLAVKIECVAVQDCVAREEDGHLQFTSRTAGPGGGDMSRVKKIWIVPVNDLEAVEIRNLLADAGEKVLVTQQRWGASWENLEGGVVAEVNFLLQSNLETEVVGIELFGACPWSNSRTIDHHSWGNGDNSHEKSSIEQIAEELGIELNRYLRLVAANDKAWYPGLEAAGATTGEADVIRQADRCAQGVTPDDEAQAVRDIESVEYHGERVLVRTSLSSYQVSPISDRLYGHAEEWLIVASNAWIYNGPRHLEIFQHMGELGLIVGSDWKGGSDESGYAGFVVVDDESLQQQRKPALTEFFWK